MIPDLNLLDLIFIVILFVSILVGILRGFVKELLSIIFLILAVVLSILYYREAGRFMSTFIHNREAAAFSGFIAVFILVMSAGYLITFFLKKVVVIGPLKSIDRLLGAAFGVLRAALLCAIILFGILAFPGENKSIVRGSRFAPHVFHVIDMIMGFIPDHFRKSLTV